MNTNPPPPTGHTSPPSGRSCRHFVLFLINDVIILIVIGLALWVIHPWDRKSDKAKQDERPVAGRNPVRETIRALGRLQPSGGVIPIHGPPGDRIKEFLSGITQGAPARANDPLFRLDSYTHHRTQWELASSQWKEAKALREAITKAGRAQEDALKAEQAQLESGRELEQAAKRAELKTLEDSKEIAVAARRRLEDIRASGVRVSQQELDQARLAKEEAEAKLEAGLAQLAKTTRAYEEGKKVLQAKIEAARTQTNEALKRVPSDETLERQVDLACQQLQAAEIKAPISGTILKIVSHAGDPTGNQPVLYLADTSKMIAIAEVYESDFHKLCGWLEAPSEVKIKDRMTVEISREGILPKTLSAKVTDSGISRMIARQQVYSLNPRYDVDRRVFEVSVTIERDDHAEEARKYIGLQVDVAFQLASTSEEGSYR